MSLIDETSIVGGIQRTKTFMQIQVNRAKVVIEDVIGCATFGPEYFRKQQILNLCLPLETVQKVPSFESKIATLYPELNIRSSIRGKHIRLHKASTTVIQDYTHQCRTFGEIEINETLLVTLQYQGFSTREENCCHYWILKKASFLEEN